MEHQIKIEFMDNKIDPVKLKIIWRDQGGLTFKKLFFRIINAEESREASEEAEVKDLGSLSQAATTSIPIKPKTWLQKSWNGLRKSPTPPPPPPTELDFSKHQKDNNKQLLTVKNKSKKSSKMCLIL